MSPLELSGHIFSGNLFFKPLKNLFLRLPLIKALLFKVLFSEVKMFRKPKKNVRSRGPIEVEDDQEQSFIILKTRVVPDIRPFLISRIRPDIRFHSSDIRLEKKLFKIKNSIDK